MKEPIPLEEAYLCLDCDKVGDSAKVCPSCLSESLMSLACVLNRESPLDAIRAYVAAL